MLNIFIIIKILHGDQA